MHLSIVSRLAILATVIVALATPIGPGHAHGKKQIDEPKGKFTLWLDGVRKDARAQGVAKKTLDVAFKGLTPNPKVVKLDRRQPEFTLTFAQYLKRVVTAGQIARGRENYRKNRALLEEVGAKYGVAPSIIVALWGVETKYGKRTGDFDIIRSLATLAFDGRRSTFFRKELMAALKILDEGHISRARMIGSWAGAMGQSQFMPTSFRSFAVDHSGDGRRDIWGTKADVFASAANYLTKNGWTRGQRWGRPVKLPENFDLRLAGRKTRKKISEWTALGVRSDAPNSDLMASVVLPDGVGGAAYFAYHNFNVIRRWNPSDYFALAVGSLADKISGQ